MIKVIPVIVFVIMSNGLLAQYVHYSDRSHVTVRAPQKPLADSVVYHEWPDRCPGMSGSIPVLTSYVPRDLVLKLTEIFKGHLYAISSIKADNNKFQYKLKVCVKGEMKLEWADEEGNIIEK